MLHENYDFHLKLARVLRKKENFRESTLTHPRKKDGVSEKEEIHLMKKLDVDKDLFPKKEMTNLKSKWEIVFARKLLDGSPKMTNVVERNIFLR